MGVVNIGELEGFIRSNSEGEMEESHAGKKMSPKGECSSEYASQPLHTGRAKTSTAPKAIPMEVRRTLCHQPEGRNFGTAPFPPLKGM